MTERQFMEICRKDNFWEIPGENQLMEMLVSFIFTIMRDSSVLCMIHGAQFWIFGGLKFTCDRGKVITCYDVVHDE